MTKQERNLIRDAMMFAVKDMTGRVMREATVQSMIDDFEKAINYTHCCESDNELLKAKQKLSFEDWYITYGYAKSVAGNFVKEGVRYTPEEMQFKYDYNMP